MGQHGLMALEKVVDAPDIESLIKRCFETTRRHVRLLLKDKKMNEKEVQAKMDSLRKRAES